MARSDDGPAALASKRRRRHPPPGGASVLVDLTAEAAELDVEPLAARSLMNPEVLLRLVGLAGLSAASYLAKADLCGSEGVRRLFGRRLAHLSRYARSIWVEGPLVVRDAALAALARPLPQELRCRLLDALVEVAAARNRCPLRVTAIWYSQQTQCGMNLKIDFKCPRRHGALQSVRGVPTAYTMRHGTDDLTLTCTSCNRGQIEEDPKLFHCPRFGCCYDLCLLCAEGLARHRRLQPE